MQAGRQGLLLSLLVITTVPAVLQCLQHSSQHGTAADLAQRTQPDIPDVFSGATLETVSSKACRAHATVSKTTLHWLPFLLSKQSVFSNHGTAIYQPGGHDNNGGNVLSASCCDDFYSLLSLLSAAPSTIRTTSVVAKFTA
jgi:hypothetical protein